MKAVTVSFDRNGTGMFKTLLDAFIASWRINATIPLEVHYTDAPLQQTRMWGFDANHYKLCKWHESVKGDTILLDSDMICQRDITCGFDYVEHIGVCQRTGTIPYNGGVIFVKNTPQALAFMDQWLEVDRRMVIDVELHRQYHKIYAGMNQSSFGWMMENGYDDLVTILPTRYNLTEPWQDWLHAYMIHIKGNLRASVFAHRPDPKHEQIVDLWRFYADQET